MVAHLFHAGGGHECDFQELRCVCQLRHHIRYYQCGYHNLRLCRQSPGFQSLRLSPCLNLHIGVDCLCITSLNVVKWYRSSLLYAARGIRGIRLKGWPGAEVYETRIERIKGLSWWQRVECKTSPNAVQAALGIFGNGSWRRWYLVGGESVFLRGTAFYILPVVVPWWWPWVVGVELWVPVPVPVPPS